MWFRIVGTLKGLSDFYRIRDWTHYVGFAFLGVVLAGQLNVNFWRTAERMMMRTTPRPISTPNRTPRVENMGAR